MWEDILKNNRFNTEKEAVEYAIKLAKQTNKIQIVADVNMKGDFVVEDNNQNFSNYDPDYSYQDDKFIIKPNGIVFSARTELPSEKYHTSQELAEFERMRREEHTRKYGKFFEKSEIIKDSYAGQGDLQKLQDLIQEALEVAVGGEVYRMNPFIYDMLTNVAEAVGLQIKPEMTQEYEDRMKEAGLKRPKSKRTPENSKKGRR